MTPNDLIDVDVPDRSAAVPRSTERDVDVARAQQALSGRKVWHVNATPQGGGVAELLQSTVRAHREAGIECGWLVPAGDLAFFETTKQLHHLLHESKGHGRLLTDDDRSRYRKTTECQASDVLAEVQPDDLVVLHDPQTLGLASTLRSAGISVAWRSHIGTENGGPLTAHAWDFLSEHLGFPQRLAFSSADYVPPIATSGNIEIIPPSIDPNSVKCAPMDANAVHELLGAIGLEQLPSGTPRSRAFAGFDKNVRLFQDAVLSPDSHVVTQVSRWDPLKDMLGVMRGFALHIAARSSAHLLLVGQDPDDIPDDPENAEVLEEVLRERESFTPEVRERIHIAVLRLTDRDANATVVNAVQRRSTILVQKSLREGFGLTVTEAMWKKVPVIASAVGGLREQVVDGKHGRLLVDPQDLSAFGDAVVDLLENEVIRVRLAEAAHMRCSERYVIDRELRDYLRMYQRMLTLRPYAARPVDGDRPRRQYSHGRDVELRSEGLIRQSGRDRSTAG